MRPSQERAWRSRLCLAYELGVKSSALDALIVELPYNPTDYRTLGSLQVLSPELCAEVAAVASRRVLPVVVRRDE